MKPLVVSIPTSAFVTMLASPVGLAFCSEAGNIALDWEVQTWECLLPPSHQSRITSSVSSRMAVICPILLSHRVPYSCSQYTHIPISKSGFLDEILFQLSIM